MHDCKTSEKDRMNMNLRQPPLMKNYTSAGYAKMSAPAPVTRMLKEVWDARDVDEYQSENWARGTTYVNHWDSPTYMIPVPKKVEESIVQYVQPIMERWIGGNTPLVLTSIYGIRVYEEGAILAPHVDRLPLVTSCILQVAQEVDEDWPLEIIDHSGNAVNITAYPGDMIIYEGHSIIHGRPFPLQGEFYANIFVHFEPIEYTERHTNRDEEDQADLARLYQLAMDGKRRVTASGKSSGSDVPNYIPEEKHSMWRQEYVYQQFVAKQKSSGNNDNKRKDEKKQKTEGLTAHTAAATGRLSLLKIMEERDPKVLVSSDVNGWRPLHEAARRGQTAVIKYLLENYDHDVNERTNDGRGGTALFWAEQMLDEDHEVINYLKKKGAKNISPEYSRKDKTT